MKYRIKSLLLLLFSLFACNQDQSASVDKVSENSQKTLTPSLFFFPFSENTIAKFKIVEEQFKIVEVESKIIGGYKNTIGAFNAIVNRQDKTTIINKLKLIKIQGFEKALNKIIATFEQGTGEAFREASRTAEYQSNNMDLTRPLREAFKAISDALVDAANDLDHELK